LLFLAAGHIYTAAQHSADAYSNELAQFAGALVLSACTLFAFSQVPGIKNKNPREVQPTVAITSVLCVAQTETGFL
jgi:hypothetical protein